VLVVEPDASCPLDRFGQWLPAEGVLTRVVRPYAGDPVPSVLGDDALVVLGGDMSALDDAGHPWLADVRGLLRDAAGRGRPVLGICLGAQLLAQAFGGTVAVGRHGTEAGVVTVDWRPGAEDDPLVGGLPGPLLSSTMHGDAVEVLPDRATWLGSAGPYAVQAFRVGGTAWGVQFHPEVSPDRYRSWVAELDSGDEAHIRALAGVRDVDRLDAEITAHTHALARRFAALVHRSADVPVSP
jgi:GMP synthase (glutamine-hydrolysing)